MPRTWLALIPILAGGGCDAATEGTLHDESHVARCAFEAPTAAADLRVELTWESGAGGARPADLDLHLLHPDAIGVDVDADAVGDGWFDVPYDVFWYNPEPRWGEPEAPVRHTHHPDCLGEVVAAAALTAPGTYRVGVHHFDDYDTGAARATVRVLVRSALALRVERPLVSDDLWEVATITWPAGEVRRAAQGDGAARVFPDVRATE